MALTIDDVTKIAILARLRLTPDQEDTFAIQLGHVVDYIDQLQAIDAAPSGALPAGASREAEDRIAPCLARDAFLQNAPAALGAFLVVPEVKAPAGSTGPAGSAHGGEADADPA
jgi:aspartyl-tRNA(Asn)/glutamyl-tRNA(Gln) amidotransferase subunit C